MKLLQKCVLTFYSLGIFLILFYQLEEISSAKILIPLFLGTRSHRNSIEPLFLELAKRGHQITIISSYKSSKQIKNIKDIGGPNYIPSKHIIPNLFEAKLKNQQAFQIFDFIPLYVTMCRNYYEMPEMKEILIENFDLLILNGFINECAFGLVHHFNTSFILFSATSTPSWILPSLGSPNVPSFNPFLMSCFTDEMNYFERIQNFISHIKYYIIRNYYYNKYMESLYQEYFPNAPSINDIEKNVSLILSNTHISINYPRPYLPDTIEIGGLSCRSETQPLPKDLQDFMDDSGKEGFIYFSLGSYIQSSELPEHLRIHIIKSFSKLKQRVLWKWETETMANLPKNVKLGKWLPQQAILSHPNIKIFITHGGILSLHEAVCYGVPLIGIPIYTDQEGNLEIYRKKRVALILQLKDINEENLTKSINSILYEPKFHKNAKELSDNFRDNPEPPLEKAIFWTEYVIRHKGAVHLRSPARDLNFIQYHSIDILLTFAALLFLSLYFVSKLIRLCVKCLFYSSKENNFNINNRGENRNKKILKSE